MSTNREFADYICEQLRDVQGIVCKKMFGEYGIWMQGKIIMLICDNRLFLKPTAAGRALLREMDEAAPYDGAKPYYLISDPDDSEYLAALLNATFPELPEPKKRRQSL